MSMFNKKRIPREMTTLYVCSQGHESELRNVPLDRVDTTLEFFRRFESFSDRMMTAAKPFMHLVGCNADAGVGITPKTSMTALFGGGMIDRESYEDMLMLQRYRDLMLHAKNYDIPESIIALLESCEHALAACAA